MTFASLYPSTVRRIGFALAPALLLAACSQEAEPPAPEPEATATPTAGETESVSILRPEIEPPEPREPELSAYTAVIGFPEGGNDLSEEAVTALQQALASPQMALGQSITLGAHSDSSGSDRVNLDASEARGLAIAEWLIGNGVDADRITVIAFGEQNPAQPNALPDGSPNEEGRAANRRVEIEIAVPAPVDNDVEKPLSENSEDSEREASGSDESVEASD